MNRIEKLFKNKPTGILSVYFSAGYPSLEDTEPVICELASQGVDLIEVGIPFSDPMADGIVIQNSGQIALQNGITLKKIFEQLKDTRKKVNIPLIMMGYLNPIIQYGVEQFCIDCAKVGIDGVIIPDLPFNDYMKEYQPLAKKYNLNFIMLITPETSEERIHQIDQNTNGFIYMVSTAATTGTRSSFSEKTINYFNRISSMKLKNPRLIGFGISNAETFCTAQNYASGAIIGSRFIKALSSNKTIKEAVSELVNAINYKNTVN